MDLKYYKKRKLIKEDKIDSIVYFILPSILQNILMIFQLRSLRFFFNVRFHKNMNIRN